MKPLDEVYTLDTERLRVLQRDRARRSDPVTGDEFAAGDRIVFCGECTKPHLLSSWQGYADRCSCWRGVQTMARFAPFEPVPPATDISAPASQPRQWGTGTLILAVLAAIGVTALVAVFILRTTSTRSLPLALATPPVVLQSPKRPAVNHAAVASVLQRKPRAVKPTSKATAKPAAVPTTEPTPTLNPTTQPTISPWATTFRISPTSKPYRASPRAALTSRAIHQIARAQPEPLPAPPDVIYATLTPMSKVPASLGKATTPAPRELETVKACATIDFLPVGQSRITGGMVHQRVRVDVTYGDGSMERAVFPYEWVFTVADDPWSNENMKKEMNLALQQPPSSLDVSTFPPLIQTVLRHSRPDGTTDFVECPQGRR